MRALSLLVSFEIGCTTSVINLAIGDGGAEVVNAARPDAGEDAMAMAKEDAPEDVKKDAPEDSIKDASGDAFSEAFQKAYDAGPVGGPGHYVQFRCCAASGLCTEEVLGGPDACYNGGDWKTRIDCGALGSLQAYTVFGACTAASGP